MNLILALWKGRALANKETWAKFGEASSIVLAVLTAVISLAPEFSVSPEFLQVTATFIAKAVALGVGATKFDPTDTVWITSFAGGVFTIGWNWYFKVVTSEKKGFGTAPTTDATGVLDTATPVLPGGTSDAPAELTATEKAKGLVGGQ